MELNEMKTPELVEHYNKLARRAGLDPVTRFKSKAVAIARIEELQAQAGKINWPFAGEVKHKVRDNTLQAKILKALRRGATMNAMLKILAAHDAETGATPKDPPASRVRSNLRTLHRYNGYGVQQVGSKFLVVEA